MRKFGRLPAASHELMETMHQKELKQRRKMFDEKLKEKDEIIEQQARKIEEIQKAKRIMSSSTSEPLPTFETEEKTKPILAKEDLEPS